MKRHRTRALFYIVGLHFVWPIAFASFAFLAQGVRAFIEAASGSEKITVGSAIDSKRVNGWGPIEASRQCSPLTFPHVHWHDV